eukprot:COSAG01_NODE_16480_length_1233_cov_1.466490_2_plen_133_part_01
MNYLCGTLLRGVQSRIVPSEAVFSAVKVKGRHAGSRLYGHLVLSQLRFLPCGTQRRAAKKHLSNPNLHDAPARRGPSSTCTPGASAPVSADPSGAAAAAAAAASQAAHTSSTPTEQRPTPPNAPAPAAAAPTP